MEVCQYCKHKWTIVAKQFIVLYLCHNGVKSRLKVYYRPQLPAGTVCSIISGHMIAPLCRGKPTVRTISTASGESRERTSAGFYSMRISWWALLPGSKQTRQPADTELYFCDAPTTTLPSEGHQNVLVNAVFVLRRGRWAQDVFEQPQQQGGLVCVGGWGGGMGWCGISKGLLYTCMLHLWVNKVWKSAVRGSPAQELLQVECGTWRVNHSWAQPEKIDECMLGKWILSALICK